MRDTLPTRLAELEKANRTNNVSRIRSIAHQLKGAAGDTALQAIYETVSQLEQHALNSELSLIPTALGELEARIDKTLHYLQDALAGEWK